MRQNDKLDEEFIKAYDELADMLFRRFYFKLSKRERSKDLVQETFTRAWQYLQRGKEVNNIKAFIYKIANNLIIDEYRSRKTVSLDVLIESGFDVQSGDNSGHERIMLDAETSNLLKIIDRLPDTYREVITLRYIEGFSHQTIAGLIGKTENAVSVRINRATKKLQEILNL